jgi:Zn-dependent peptidase ImmA (M78 family)
VSRNQYYEQMKDMARQVRAEYGLSSCRVLKSDLKRIYKAEGVRIDVWPYKLKEVRGAYFRDTLEPTVMVAKLPNDPFVFTLAHELKHHLFDHGAAVPPCGARNESEHVEIGAEIFAAELLFPEADFSRLMADLGVGSGACKPTHIVQVKRRTKTTLSYLGLVKRAEFLGFAAAGSLPRLGWKVLEEKIYGVPFYKRAARRKLPA